LNFEDLWYIKDIDFNAVCVSGNYFADSKPFESSIHDTIADGIKKSNVE